jgi:DNA-binding MarR family transcriptional regulator
MQSLNPFVTTLQEWFEIFRRHLMRNIFTYAKDRGLTMAQFGAMLNIYHKGACGVSDIGNDLGVTNSAASQMLERMVQQKIITRTEDPNDRRVKQIVLTEKGCQILEESSHANQGWLEELASKMTAVEQEQVRDALVILIEKANEHEITPINKSDF